MAIASGYVSVLVMALYLKSSAMRDLYSTPEAFWGICLVLLYWISRLWLLTRRGQLHDDPVVFTLTDGVSYLTGVLIVAIAMIAKLF